MLEDNIMLENHKILNFLFAFVAVPEKKENRLKTILDDINSIGVLLDVETGYDSGFLDRLDVPTDPSLTLRENERMMKTLFVRTSIDKEKMTDAAGRVMDLLLKDLKLKRWESLFVVKRLYESFPRDKLEQGDGP